MNCPKCGYEGLLEGTKHCPRCGVEISKPDKPTPFSGFGLKRRISLIKRNLLRIFGRYSQKRGSTTEIKVSQKLKQSENITGVNIEHAHGDIILASESENDQPIGLDYKPYLIWTYRDLKEELDFSIPRTLESNVTESENHIIPIEEVLSTGKHALILGDPGSGKTYITKYLAKHIIERDISVENPKIPVRIKAKMWGNQFNTIPEAISKELEYLVDNINPGIVKSDINANKFIIIIDGYDEIRGEKKSDLTLEIGRIASSRKAQIILTSREANYHKPDLPSF